MGLPDLFTRWFTSRGWTPRRHQLALIELAKSGRSALLIAPTGGGKTLAGFLPSLVELTERRQAGKDLAFAKGKGELHTLYISPLKALATDIRRNLELPIAEMQLPVRAESRTGDTPQSRRLRQRERPPDLLMTTPESLALLLSYPDAEKFFASLRCAVVDELHSFATTKRGHHLALCLARLAALSPQTRFVGLSATVADPPALADYLRLRDGDTVEIVQGEPGAPPKVTIVDTQERLPWGGHMGHHAVPEVYNIIRQHRTSIVFVNTRAQAELVFDNLWRINEENLAIGLHHGSLAVEQRRKVEAAMAAGKLRLANLTVIVDYNKHQSYASTAEVQDLEPLLDKWTAFGFAARDVDGHDVASLVRAFAAMPFDDSKPTALICHTVKGRGVPFAENNLDWHHKSKLTPKEIEDLQAALA